MDYDIAIDVPCTIELPSGKFMRIVGIDYSLVNNPSLLVKYMTKEQVDVMLKELDSATSR